MKRYLLQVILIVIILVFGYATIRFNQLQNTQSYFDNLEEALQNPEQVRILIIRNQPIDSLPERIGEFVNMKILNLADNELTRLPESIGRLTNLQELSCVNNQLTHLPASIRNLKHLKVLNLSGNLFTALPAPLRQLDSLRLLNMAGNKIASIDLRQLPYVVDVDLSENDIYELLVGARPRSVLQKLDLYHNRLQKIPEKLFELPQLNELILSGNPLDESSKANYDNFIKIKSGN